MNYLYIAFNLNILTIFCIRLVFIVTVYVGRWNKEKEKGIRFSDDFGSAQGNKPTLHKMYILYGICLS